MKKLLFKFIKRFYNPDLAYIDPLIKQWVNKLITLIVEIIFIGLLFFLFLTSLTIIFPKTTEYIYLGTSISQIPLFILWLGIIYWFSKRLFETILKTWRKKK